MPVRRRPARLERLAPSDGHHLVPRFKLETIALDGPGNTTHTAQVYKLRWSAGGDSALRAFLRDREHSSVARGGVLIDPLQLPAVLAETEGDLAGALTYSITDSDCEILTLHTARRWGGIGTALLTEVARIGAELGCTQYQVTTTNDNVDALRFYQRRGFHIVRIRPGAVDDARRNLKPAIPIVGDYGIPLRDEIDLSQALPLSVDSG